MKKIAFVLINVLLFGVGTIKAQDQLLSDSEPISSGCLKRNNRSNGDEASSFPTIKLTKVGSILSVDLLNYNSNCGTTGFDMESQMSSGNDDIPSVVISVVPVIPAEKDCYCPFNISYTVRDFEKNKFFLTCWWYEGEIELTEGEPLVLEYKTEGEETDDSDYIPFVEKGKQWHVVRSDCNSGSPIVHYEKYMLNEEVVKDGKTYLKMYRSEDDLTVLYESGLLREEDRKVYIYDADMQEEHLIFDYSLKVGDTYEAYSSFENKMVSYKVMSIDDCTEGPEEFHYGYDVPTYSFMTRHRHLQKWTVCRTDYESIQKTWIEGVGSLDGPLGNLQDIVLPDLCKDYLAYVDGRWGELYLPFSCYDEINKQIHGSNLPTGAKDDNSSKKPHELTYELEGNRLHVYGKVNTQCGPHNYAYFRERETDDPLTHRVSFWIQEVEPLMDCLALHATDFYVPGFDPNLNYIVIDSDGEEHPVINKTPQNEYRPFVEEGKVWQVGAEGSGNPVQIVEYYYFDGDTIIDGKACKQMMCQRFVSPDSPKYDAYLQQPSLNYVGAWYEEDKKVYEYDSTRKEFTMMYDFSLEDNGTFLTLGQYYVVGPRQTGGMKGFKGIYRDVLMYKDGGSIARSTPWLEGVGGVYGPTVNVFDGELADPMWFLMACAVDDEVIYLNDEYEDGATPENMGAQKRRFDFTHTVKTQPKNPRRREAEQSLYGEYNDKLLGINLDPIDDAYLVRITDETGKVVYEKAIDAGNIVALNVDISSYAIGRYTVTVENSQESFTGEFETQTTGIEEISSKRSEVRDYIYNLQGQRLTSLQKGLNIVNGKKVYVK